MLRRLRDRAARTGIHVFASYAYAGHLVYTGCCTNW